MSENIDAKPLRVLHVIGSTNPKFGGPIEGIKQLAAQRKIRHRGVTEIVSLDSPDSPWLSELEITVYPCGDISDKSISKAARYGFSWKLVKWLRLNGRKYDVVVVNGLWNFTTLAFRLSGLYRHIPFVVFPHGMLDPWFRRRYPLKHWLKQIHWLLAEGPLTRRASAVLFTTTDELRLAEKSFWPYRLTPIMVGYGTAAPPDYRSEFRTSFYQTVQLPPASEYILFLSRIHEKKGVDIAISSFADALSADSNIHLVIAGPDEQNRISSLKELAKKKGVANRVHFPGMLRGDVKWGSLYLAKAFLLPSHQENFGIVVAEALSVGLPVIISNKVNIATEVWARKAGIIADDNIDSTTRAIKEFFSFPKTVHADLAKNAKDLFLDEYEISSVSRRLEELLSRLARREI